MSANFPKMVEILTIWKQNNDYDLLKERFNQEIDWAAEQLHQEFLMASRLNCLALSQIREIANQSLHHILNKNFLRQINHSKPFYKNNLKNGISAIMRAYNDQDFIQASILSIYEKVDEIVVCLNRCTDATECIIDNLIHQGFHKIKKFKNDVAIVPFSIGYIDRAPNGSMAELTNFAAEQANYSWHVRWDADMIAIPTEFNIYIDEIKKTFDSENHMDVIYCAGIDILERPFSAELESRFYKVTENNIYLDLDTFEQLYHNYPETLTIRPCYLHMKFLKSDYLHLMNK